MSPNDRLPFDRQVETSEGCAPFESRLEALVDGELEAPERRSVERHLDECAACRDRFDLALAVKQELGALPSLDAPREVVEAVLGVARSDSSRSATSAARDRRRWSAWRSVLRPLPVAAALAAVLAAALWLVPRRIEEVPVEGSVADAVVTEGSIVESAEVERVAVERAAAERVAVQRVAVERAAAEARWALAFVSTVSRRTGEQIRDDVIAKRWIGATARSLSAVAPQDTLGGQRPEEVSGRHET